MANKKISELTSATQINSADVLPIVQSSFTKKIAYSIVKLATLALSALTEKVLLANDDLLLLNDSAASNTPKKTKFSNLVSSVEANITLPNLLEGLTLSNNGSDANNDIDIAAGTASDSTRAFIIDFPSGMTKRLDASFAEGTNQGGLRAALTKQNNTWYYYFLIYRGDTDHADIFIDNSATPTLPANYTYYRLIGAVVTDGSGNIRGITEEAKGIFRYKTPIVNLNASPANTNRNLVAVTAPPNSFLNGVIVYGYLSGGNNYSWFDTVNRVDAAASVTNQTHATSANLTQTVSRSKLKVDSSSQIAYRSTGAASVSVIVFSEGYEMVL